MRSPFVSWILTALVLGLAAEAAAAPPWAAFVPFKRVEADPGKAYTLNESHGPWLILATSFAGEGAEEQAHELVLELRRRFRVAAYVDQRVFDFTEPVVGKSIDRFTGEPARMKYANYSRHESYAVLVGDFEKFDDPKMQEMLQEIKYMRPDCLDLAKRKDTAQWFAGVRESFRQINGDPSKRKKGPMGNAFVTRNPHLPEEFFAPSGLDDFVIQLNRDVKYSLLSNPGKYTVKVASFGGRDTMKLEEIEELERTGKVSNKLEVAADKAHRLTMALRNRHVDAYEFHDRTESIVTIGSFDSIGEPRADGKTEINPAVHQVMQQWGANRQPLPGQAVGLQPRTLDGIAFDVQPVPVVVPRRSLAADYSRNRSASR